MFNKNVLNKRMNVPLEGRGTKVNSVYLCSEKSSQNKYLDFWKRNNL